jgi:hypothetical protein
VSESNFCGCISGDRTCWFCSTGRHDKCTADQHGDPAAQCPRTEEGR